MKIPIAIKMVFLTVLLLATASFLIVYESKNKLVEKLSEREKDSMGTLAEHYSDKVEQFIFNNSEKIKTLGISYLSNLEANTQAVGNENRSTDLVTTLSKTDGLVNIYFYKMENSQPTLIYSYVNKDKLQEKYPGSHPAWFQAKSMYRDFPVAEIASGATGAIKIFNSSQANKAGFFSIGVPLKVTNGSVTHVAVADMELDPLLRMFKDYSPRTWFLTDTNGIILSHEDSSKAIFKENLSQHPLVKKIVGDANSKILKGDVNFQDLKGNTPMLGTFERKNNLGLIVFGVTKQELVLQPAQIVTHNTIKTTALVLSASLFFIFLFSMSLTSPIEKLAELIAVVSKGNFDVSARARVKSRDEVGDLAIAFDKMTEGLRERDKVKSLFSKFHGTSITEDLLSKDIGVGGIKKDVVVFFSDIRGFTAFSESRTPEEVVSMLNEYFEVMVKIIISNHGVVDKFIGDAIMAVWGAPKSSGKDCYYAVKACIEMRQALDKLNEGRKQRHQPPIMIGMGLHAGSAISGNIGSEQKLEYTVIGDTVNMTSRIEASTKAFGTDLLISETVFDKVQEEFGTDYAGAAEVKGKTEPIRLFKVRGPRNQQTGEIVDIITPYSEYEKEKADKAKIVA